ncbi:MAG: hypothetical protein GY861_27120 [bacterium]|nr:hypothetical protein [bacterium]
MKLSIRTAIIVMALILLCPVVSASFYTINYSCDGDCIEGADVSWEINMSNQGSRDIRVYSLEIIDSLTEIQLAFYNGSEIKVSPEKHVDVSLNGTIPEANNGTDLMYQLCMVTEVPEGVRMLSDVFFGTESRYCYRSHYMPAPGCTRGGHCKTIEACLNYSCTKLRCNSCQFISDHSCVNYECCEDEECMENQMCINATNECVALECKEDEYILNHSCSRLVCGNDEIIRNHKCEKLNCSEDESASGHECIKLDCGEHEYIKHNACWSLECEADEHAVNHSCEKLNCSEDEQILDHACADLNCWFFQDAEDHKCVNVAGIVQKSIYEIVALVAILIVVLLIFIKYKLRRKAQNIKAKPELKKFKMKKIMLLLFLVSLFSVSYVSAATIGVSGTIDFTKVLKGGYAERVISISTNSEEEVFAHFVADGDVKDWLSFDPDTDRINFSIDRQYKLKIIVQPPEDTKSGNYSGKLVFITDAEGAGSGRAGSAISVGVESNINIEVVGGEIVGCSAGAFRFSDAEINYPFKLGVTVRNTGNVRISPELTVDVWDQLQENLVLTKNFDTESVLPTVDRTSELTFSTNKLPVGQYWVKMSMPECFASDFHTFTVVEEGGILDKGHFAGIKSDVWAFTGQPILITATFANTGQRMVMAKFKGNVKLDDRIVHVLETDELRVEAGEKQDFDIYFTPEKAGHYIASGRFTYNDKLTFERSTVLNVNDEGEEEIAEEKEKKQFSFVLLAVYIVIIVTIFFLVRLIVLNKRKRF